MGIYDREYYQDEPPRGFQIGGGGGGALKGVTLLIIINCVVYFGVELLFKRPPVPADAPRLASIDDIREVLDAGKWDTRFPHQLSLWVVGVMEQPWRAYQFLTAGFMHAPIDSKSGIFHILLNMFMLFMFGREIEMRYGRREFLTFFLFSVIVANIIWFASKYFTGAIIASALGASGGVSAVVILFCLNFPRQKIYLWGLVQMPAWGLGVLLVGFDLLRSFNPDSPVGWEAHLGGAAVALIYFKLKWRLSRFLPSKLSMKRKPRLKVHRPDQDVTEQADRILKKVHEHGLDSLSAKERKILEKHSREVRDRRGS